MHLIREKLCSSFILPVKALILSCSLIKLADVAEYDNER